MLVQRAVVQQTLAAMMTATRLQLFRYCQSLLVPREEGQELQQLAKGQQLYRWMVEGYLLVEYLALVLMAEELRVKELSQSG